MEIDLKLCNFAAEKASLLGACPQQGVGMKVKNKPWHSLIYTPAESEGSAYKNSDFSLETPSGNLWTVAMKVHDWRYKWLHRWFVTTVTRVCIRCCY